MGITIDINNDKSSLSIDGDLTIYSVQQYQKSLVDKFSADKMLELDLSGVDEIDISGLQLLAAISKQLSNSGNEMIITQASDVATEALDTSCLLTDMKDVLAGENHES